MANWKVEWVCQDCGDTIWSAEMPGDWECSCTQPVRTHAEECVQVPMSKEERKERYRIAYHLRGSTWEGTTAYMYQGDIAEGQHQVRMLKGVSQ